MSTHESRHDFRRHIRVCVYVFLALLAGTALTVGVRYAHLPSLALGIILALVIAGMKASLVASFFMHLIAEKRAIYLLLAFTAVILLGLLLLTVWAAQDIPRLNPR